MTAATAPPLDKALDTVKAPEAGKFYSLNVMVCVGWILLHCVLKSKNLPYPVHLSEREISSPSRESCSHTFLVRLFSREGVLGARARARGVGGEGEGVTEGDE